TPVQASSSRRTQESRAWATRASPCRHSSMICWKWLWPTMASTRGRSELSSSARRSFRSGASWRAVQPTLHPLGDLQSLRMNSFGGFSRKAVKQSRLKSPRRTEPDIVALHLGRYNEVTPMESRALRVLVAEDQEDTATNWGILLRLYGYEVEIAADGP